MIQTIQKETKAAVTTMEEGTKQVEEGMATTSNAGDALRQIIQMSEQVGEMASHIAAAATQQSSAAEQINSNMDRIAKLVKESADGARQSAKAREDRSNLAFEMQKMVSTFKVDEHGHPTQQTFTRSSERENKRTKAFSAGAN